MALAGALVLAAASARADDDLVLRPAVDIPIVTIGGLGLLLSNIFESKLAPATCNWCDVNGLDAGMRSAVRWDDENEADFLGHLTAFGLAPAAALGLTALAAGHDGRLGGWPTDAFLIAESTLIAADINQAAKLTFGRQRPSVAFKTGNYGSGSGDNLSFFSGDTTVAFSLGVSAGTIASMRGYRLAPLVWATGLTFGVTTGYLRMAADRHYFTDVLTGAIVGSAVGFAVPYLLHKGDPTDGTEVQHGGVVTFSGRF